MPPKKTGTAGAKKASKMKTKANPVRAKTATKKKTKTSTAKAASKMKTKTNPVKVNKGPKHGKKVTVKGNKPAPPKKKTTPNTGMKSTNQKPKAGKKTVNKKPKADPVKGGVGPKKRKNPNPAQGQNPAKKIKKAPEYSVQSLFVKALPNVQRSVPPAILPVCNIPVPAPVQPSVHVDVNVPVGNITVQTSGRSDSCQPSGVPMNRRNNDEVVNQRVTTNAAVCAQSNKIDNSQTGNENIEETTIENLLFLRKNRVQLIDRIKNVTEILDHLELSDEKAAKVRAERTDQEKMRKLLEFTTSTYDAKRLVIALWRCARYVMEDLTNTNYP
ncbi:uncharacterized protein LOC113523936 isoform X2 [Pangasianodon hypophthalmus]|uniref:uncharacterized protein LOC113523936 isoform X2 n=1 Tax=Pangasianodon hypophthalmus TaxID=310915 RepID=UPI002307F0DB|nr:uncharacterized protein LOC113523936 isoform X2 [Pangasianodon hypophthalmus]